MGSRSSQDGSSWWSRAMRKRAARGRRRKKLAAGQRRWLRGLKTRGQLRAIVLGSRHLKPRAIGVRGKP
jgi:hypothetical protein